MENDDEVISISLTRYEWERIKYATLICMVDIGMDTAETNGERVIQNRRYRTYSEVLTKLENQTQEQN